jgi:predicted DNA-binding protein (MmcQ/YjbR family)
MPANIIGLGLLVAGVIFMIMGGVVLLDRKGQPSRDEIVAAGEASPHHILPETGWVSFYLKEDGDVERALALLKRSYEIALKQKGRLAKGHE